jgi:hypothetical protein
VIGDWVINFMFPHYYLFPIPYSPFLILTKVYNGLLFKEELGGPTKDRNVGKTDDQFYLFCFDYKLNKGFAGY